MEMLHLNVRGMSCGACVRHVSRVLDGLAGVTVRSVEIGSADVEYDPAAATADRVRQALADAGYPTAAPTALPLAGGSGGGGCCCGGS